MNSRHLDRIQAAERRSAATGETILADPHTTTELQDAVAEALMDGTPLMTVAALADLSPLAALDALDARERAASPTAPPATPAGA